MTDITDAATGSSFKDCLLVVDDQEANIQVLGAMLGKLGFEILPALSVKEALKHLETRTPDLILLELMMPGRSGFELCRLIQEHPAWAEIPVIFLSAADDRNLVVRALESGGVDYVIKPFDKLELVSRIRTHLMHKSTREHLTRLAQDREEMLGIITHQLQNHFAAMEMSAQVLLNRTQGQDEANTRMLVEIRNMNKRMRVFVKSFLANAAADHGVNVKLRPVDLAAAAAAVARQFDDLARAKNITLIQAVPEGNVPVEADPIALAQILDNLISNAVKFSPLGGEVKVTVQANATRTECQVSDQGVGLTAEDKVKLFGRYARLSARPTSGEPSTGLGLSIARKLARAMGAELRCESEPGQGATFILTFPALAGTTGGNHELSGH